MRHLSRSLSLLAASAALAGSAAAADVAVNDLRAHVVFSVTDDFEASAGGVSDEGNYDTLGFDVQYVRSLPLLGLFVGGDVFHATGSGELESSDLDVDTTTLGINLYVGWAIGLPGVPVHVELNPFIGFGTQNTELSSGGAEVDDDDTVFQYGLRAASYFTFGGGWQAGVEARYLIDSTSEPSIEGNDLEIENSGLSIAVGGGYRF